MSNPASAPSPTVVTANGQQVTYRVLPSGAGDPTSQGVVPLDPNSEAFAYPEHGGGNVFTWNKEKQTWNP